VQCGGWGEAEISVIDQSKNKHRNTQVSLHPTHAQTPHHTTRINQKQCTHCPVLQDSEIRGNSVTDRGAGFSITSLDSGLFRNVRVSNNAAVQGGGGWCGGAGTVAFQGSVFEANGAQMGGGVYAKAPCTLNMEVSVRGMPWVVRACIAALLASPDSALLSGNRFGCTTPSFPCCRVQLQHMP
jgi:hypothetical protein